MHLARNEQIGFPHLNQVVHESQKIMQNALAGIEDKVHEIVTHKLAHLNVLGIANKDS